MNNTQNTTSTKTQCNCTIVTQPKKIAVSMSDYISVKGAVYDAYEIHGCAELPHEEELYSYVEQVPDSEADYWTLFGHMPGFGVEAICDFGSREQAELVYYRITGRPYSGEVLEGQGDAVQA